jgi:hypothetical protein
MSDGGAWLWYGNGADPTRLEMLRILQGPVVSRPRSPSARRRFPRWPSQQWRQITVAGSGRPRVRAASRLCCRPPTVSRPESAISARECYRPGRLPSLLGQPVSLAAACGRAWPAAIPARSGGVPSRHAPPFMSVPDETWCHAVRWTVCLVRRSDNFWALPIGRQDRRRLDRLRLSR